MLSLYILGSVVLVSLISLVGILFFAFHENFTKRYLLYFVSFSTGSLLGTVFIHMVPEMAEDAAFFPTALLILLGSFVFFFVIEKAIHWHCHVFECESHIHPVGHLTLIGDAIHNVIDGVLIAGTYLVSVPLGMATTIAVILHEIPQEIGDFAVLIYSGYTRKKAIFFNFLSALTAILGALVVLFLRTEVNDIGHYVIPIAAGSFLYIAAADLIPELHKESRTKQALLQVLCMVGGIALMYLLTMATGSIY